MSRYYTGPPRCRLRHIPLLRVPSGAPNGGYPEGTLDPSNGRHFSTRLETRYWWANDHQILFMSSLKHVYLGMGDGVACWGTLLGGSGFKSRPKYDLFLTPCTSADVPWKKVDTGGQLWPRGVNSGPVSTFLCTSVDVFWPFSGRLGRLGRFFAR